MARKKVVKKESIPQAPALKAKKFLTSEQLHSMQDFNVKLNVLDLKIENSNLRLQNLEMKKLLLESDIEKTKAYIQKQNQDRMNTVNMSKANIQNIATEHGVQPNFGFNPTTGELAE
jgi:regulator of replication initiation timing